MKIEFLANDSKDCPIIRLFDYREGEIERLCQACRDLADDRIASFALHNEPWVDSIAGCHFIWRLAKKDIGVHLPAKNEPFVLDYTAEAWRTVGAKLAHLINKTDGFNWITDEGDVNVLISPSGQW